jgi:DNA-binding HxlR family transcriptional regulator
VLSLIAKPLTVPILRAHLDGPLRLLDLRERIGEAKQTTLRGQVDNLRAIGALERHVLARMPYTVENELTEAGRDILAVADRVEAWLAQSPHGPIPLGSDEAKATIKALVDAWDSTVLHALAERPLSLVELNGVVTDISYPALERRLSAMRATYLVEIVPGGERGAKPHGVTDWTRQAVGPLVAAGRCEREHLSEHADPPTRIDLEAASLLAMPLVGLGGRRTGSGLLAVDTGASADDA